MTLSLALPERSRWILAIHARLRRGPALTSELIEACTSDPEARDRVRNRIIWLGSIRSVDRRRGPSGQINHVWVMK